MSATLEHDVSYQASAAEVLASLGTDVHQGLTQREAQARVTRHGRNELASEKPTSAWRRFLHQFQNGFR